MGRIDLRVRNISLQDSSHSSYVVCIDSTSFLQRGSKVRGDPGKDRDFGLRGLVHAGHGPVAPFQGPWQCGWSGGGQRQQRQGADETGGLRAQGPQLPPLCWTRRSFLDCLQLSWEGSAPPDQTRPPHLPSGSHTTGT